MADNNSIMSTPSKFNNGNNNSSLSDSKLSSQTLAIATRAKLLNCQTSKLSVAGLGNKCCIHHTTMPDRQMDGRTES